MNKQSHLDQVLTILKKEGYTDEQLAQFLVDLTKIGFERLYAQSVILFTDTDLDEIDKAQKHEVEGVIRKIFKERTGKDPQKEVTEIIDIFCQGFLKEFSQASQKSNT